MKKPLMSLTRKPKKNYIYQEVEKWLYQNEDIHIHGRGKGEPMMR